MFIYVYSISIHHLEKEVFLENNTHGSLIFLWRFEGWRFFKQAVTPGCFEADFWWGNLKIDHIPTIIYLE